MKQIIECVPNFSEGRDMEKLDKILDCFRNVEGVLLLDHSSDADHNRTVVTVVGESEPLKHAVVAAMGKAAELIDLRTHEGQHPRMGATDVVPFIPVENVTMEECIALSKEVAALAYEKHGIPSFLYEKSASRPERENLANVRKGQFEGMSEKVKQPEWTPDFGTDIHPSAGITAIGARMFLVAFNVNLDNPDVEVASSIAKCVRFLSGGLRFCKAIGIDISEKGMSQVSMNMTDYTKTPIYRSYELIGVEARRYDANIVESEIIGLVPKAALTGALDFYMKGKEYDKNNYNLLVDLTKQHLKVADFSADQILEKIIEDRL
ncbi:MAG: glutamate formimidoyltransferase [Bacillota bacterium]|nr:glutamate formimidoyltransferase [Bacillota bacterium]